MLRDNLVGLIEPMLRSAGAYPLALGTESKQSSDDRPLCLQNPRPEGAESTLAENVASPFHVEPRHSPNMAEKLAVLSLVLKFVVTVMLVLESFKVRSALTYHFNEKLAKVETFFLTIFYLQYKINRLQAKRA